MSTVEARVTVAKVSATILETLRKMTVAPRFEQKAASLGIPRSLDKPRETWKIHCAAFAGLAFAQADWHR